jgi:RNA recognition motif-containing protein
VFYLGLETRFLLCEPDGIDLGQQLPYQAGWQDLKDLFRTAGAIVRADINVGYDGRPKGSGTVIFETAKDAQAAIRKLFNSW